MSNSLLDITPHQVSRDLRGYSVLFYGSPKSGKTTTASKFPNSLILAFEKGYSAIPGIMAKPINSWNEFRKTLKELDTDEVKARFSTVVIDTGDIAYNYCDKYICNQNDVDTVGDIPYGKGYKLVANEFDDCIRRILQMNYGLVLISHSQDKTFKDESGNEYNQIIPTIDSKGRLICERTCDIIGYSRAVETEEGLKTKLFLRGTPRFVAGSRFKYIPDVIDFTYENLVAAISEAIDKEAEETGNQFVTSSSSQVYAEEKTYDFNALQDQFQTIVGELMQVDVNNAKLITSIVEKYLGKGKKVGDCTPNQAEQIDLIVYDLKNL